MNTGSAGHDTAATYQLKSSRIAVQLPLQTQQTHMNMHVIHVDMHVHVYTQVDPHCQHRLLPYRSYLLIMCSITCIVPTPLDYVMLDLPLVPPL